MGFLWIPFLDIKLKTNIMIVFQKLEWADDFESATLASVYSSVPFCMFC